MFFGQGGQHWFSSRRNDCVMTRQTSIYADPVCAFNYKAAGSINVVKCLLTFAPLPHTHTLGKIFQTDKALNLQNVFIFSPSLM